MTTLLEIQPRLAVEAINSHHQGVEFGVVHLETTDTQLSLGECLETLAEEGWTSSMRVSCARPGVKKFVISRKK
jgi:hypothetical protein